MSQLAEPPVLVAQLAGLVLPVLKLAEPPTPSTGSSPDGRLNVPDTELPSAVILADRSKSVPRRACGWPGRTAWILPLPVATR